ncbi:MAG TPA: ferritin family protein [Thermoanaerobaculaceae bacterium]|nr:ferritin family protein [Thermoanaerobaculaceae bacterium]
MELNEAITTAIGYETKVRDHYTQGAEKILDPRGKKMFATLAREEQGHLAYLESRLEEWRRTGHVSTPELATVLPPAQWIDEAKAKVSRSPAATIAVQGEIELLKIALELERRTSGFYRQLVETLALKERPLFARFLEIEQGHLALVQAEIDALAGHGTWFDVMEFRLEAG